MSLRTLRIRGWSFVCLALAGSSLRCSNSTSSPQSGDAVDLSGTATVTKGSTAVTFATAQTLAAGTVLAFSTQPGVPYTLSASIANATAGVLATAYTGPSSSTATVLDANACYP